MASKVAVRKRAGIKRRVKPSSSQPDVELLFFIVCDEVRVEAKTMKGIYIGVYTGVIVAPAPLKMDRLTLLFAIRHKGPYKPATATMTIAGPAQLPSFRFGIQDDSTLDTSIVMAELKRVELPAGEYVVTLAFENGAEFKGRFDVVIDPDIAARLG